MRIFHNCTTSGLLENVQNAVCTLLLQKSAAGIRKVV
jgi:hypothetical protein